MNDKTMTTQQKMEELKKVKREFGKSFKSSVKDVSGKWIGIFKGGPFTSETPCELFIQQKGNEIVAHVTLGKGPDQRNIPYKGSIDGNSIRIKGSSNYEEWEIDAVARENHMDGKLNCILTLDPAKPEKFVSDSNLDRKL